MMTTPDKIVVAGTAIIAIYALVRKKKRPITAEQEYPFDVYSLAHAGLGAAMAALGVSPAVALGSQVIWEMTEDRVKEGLPEVFPDARKDAFANHAGDLASFAAGYFVVPRPTEAPSI